MTNRQLSPGYPPGERQRNPVTQNRMRRTSLWQIWLPMGLTLLVVVVLMVLVSLPVGAPSRSALADVSLMFLILVMGVLGLVVLALLIGLNLGVGYGVRELPYLLKKVQDIVLMVAERIKLVAAQVANAIFTINSYLAAAQKTAENLHSILNPWRRK